MNFFKLKSVNNVEIAFRPLKINNSVLLFEVAFLYANVVWTGICFYLSKASSLGAIDSLIKMITIFRLAQILRPIPLAK